MPVKKFQARTIQEAIKQVKKNLGMDAMIMSTQRLEPNAGNGNLFEISAMPAGDGVGHADADPLRAVRNELMSIKEMVYLQSYAGGVLEKLVLMPGALMLYAELIRNGVKPHYARLFFDKALADDPQAPDAVDLKTAGDAMRQRAVRAMLKSLRVADPFNGSNGRRKIAALIGTTGVGKTTTVAKIAARLMLKAGKKVGFISIDTYRIGAMEQLKAYANILGIPCFQAFSQKDLRLALERMRQKDVILIDTAGQSQYDHERLVQLKGMLPDDPAISTHLLLSVNTTEAEMNRIAENFGALKFESYIFTKTDEAKRCGSIMNQMMKRPRPISYFTTGQNVPEDIEPADKRKLINLLLSRR